MRISVYALPDTQESSPDWELLVKEVTTIADVGEARYSPLRHSEEMRRQFEEVFPPDVG